LKSGLRTEGEIVPTKKTPGGGKIATRGTRSRLEQSRNGGSRSRPSSNKKGGGQTRREATPSNRTGRTRYPSRKELHRGEAILRGAAPELGGKGWGGLERKGRRERTFFVAGSPFSAGGEATGNSRSTKKKRTNSERKRSYSSLGGSLDGEGGNVRQDATGITFRVHETNNISAPRGPGKYAKGRGRDQAVFRMGSRRSKTEKTSWSTFMPEENGDSRAS